MNDAFERSVRLQMDEQSNGEEVPEVEHPCLHAGYNDVRYSYLFSLPCDWSLQTEESKVIVPHLYRFGML